MTPYEFKAWFEGFTASDDGPPNIAKRSVINERIADIDGFAVDEPVFFEVFCTAALGIAFRAEIAGRARGLAFDAEAAMHTLGKAESSVLFPTERRPLPDSQLMASE
jgi:hypothetical protein